MKFRFFHQSSCKWLTVSTFQITYGSLFYLSRHLLKAKFLVMIIMIILLVSSFDLVSCVSFITVWVDVGDVMLLGYYLWHDRNYTVTSQPLNLGRWLDWMVK